ncbi:MAG: gamma-glutamylcyclotransferase [Hyphomicrobiaceae bacterium]
MHKHLFVYGTLMSAADGARLGKAQRARLQREGTSLGAATIKGHLYDLRRYPALVAFPNDVAHGEVFRLANPPSSFVWLDKYEDVVPGRETNDYERVVRPVWLANGEEISAWVYLYLAEVPNKARIADGRWQPR